MDKRIYDRYFKGLTTAKEFQSMKEQKNVFEDKMEPKHSSQYSDYYNKYWKTGEGWTPEVVLPKAYWAFFEKYIGPGKTILDVGCGDGNTYARKLSATSMAYIGLDISREGTKKALKNGVKAILHDTVSEWPFAEEKFDNIICNEVLEHLMFPEAVLKEARRVLKKDGVFIIGVPNACYYIERLRFLFGSINLRGSIETKNTPWKDPHIRLFTEETLKRMMEDSGFSVIELVGVGFALPKIEKNIFALLPKLYPSLFASNLLLAAKKKD